LGLSSVLGGCPQFLADDFELSPALSPTSLDSDGATPLGPDGGVGFSGAGGAAGASSEAGAAGMGGSPAVADAGVDASTDPDSAGAGGARPDAGGGSAGAGGGNSGPGGVLSEALRHRYRFDGSGSSIVDDVGTAHGTSQNTQLTGGSGKLTLSGSDQYVDLPNGLLAGLQSVTLEAWVNWQADPSSPGANWQTVFDFGTTAQGEGAQGDGTKYLYLTAKSGDSSEIRAGYTLTGFNDETFADGLQALPVSSDTTQGTAVTLVVNGALGSLAIYIDGMLEVSTAPGQTVDLSALDDVNNWLGQSQYASDPNFAGELLDFRIYGRALSSSEVALSFQLGADADL
jgi:hypothetical protein